MITKDVYNKIKELRDIGVSFTAISKKLNMAITTVRHYYYLSEEDFDKQHQRYYKTRFHYEEFYTEMVDTLRAFPELKMSGLLNRLLAAHPEMEYTLPSFRRRFKALQIELGISPKNSLPNSPILTSPHGLIETPPPGYESQVDFGVTSMKDMYGHDRKIYIFVMVMAYSNLLFAYCQAVPFTTESACMAHRKAFEFFGGRTQTILYDNDVVFTHSHNFGEPILTRDFEQFVFEMGYGARFCKPRQPQSKSKVENGVKTIKHSFLEGKTYNGIDSLNSELLFWLDSHWNARKSQRKGVSPHELFEDEAHLLIKVPKYKAEQTIFRASGDNWISYKHNSYEFPSGKVLAGTRIKIVDEGETLAFLYAADDSFIVRHPKCTKRGMNIALPEKDVTQNRAAVETLRLRYKNNNVVEEFIRNGKGRQDRYFVGLCGRINRTAKLVPEPIIIDAIQHMITCGRHSVKEYMSYLEYRGYGDIHSFVNDRERYIHVKRAKEIAREYAKSGTGIAGQIADEGIKS